MTPGGGSELIKEVDLNLIVEEHRGRWNAVSPASATPNPPTKWLQR